MEPDVFVTLHNYTGVRIFGYRLLPDFIIAPDRGRYSTLLDLEPLELNGSPIDGDLFGGLMAVERPVARATFNNADGFFSRLVGREIVKHQSMGVVLWWRATPAHPDKIFEFFRGHVLNYRFEGDRFVVEFGEGGILFQTIRLPRADIYPRPQNRAAVLQKVYGDFLSPGTNSPDENSGGPIPLTCIDIDNNVWLASSTRCHADKPELYNSLGERQDPAAYDWHPDIDYGNVGLRVAVLHLHANISADWTVRMKGTIDSATGQLITNPVHAIRHFFQSDGGWLAGDFDPMTVPRAEATVGARGFNIGHVFRSDATPKDWLVDVFRHSFVHHSLTSDGKLSLLFDEDPVPPDKIWAFLDARADTAGEDPELSVNLEEDTRNLLNAGVIHYRLRWGDGTYTGFYPFEDPVSVRLYGRREREAGPIELPGIRTEGHVLAYVERLLRRTARDPQTLTLRLRGFKYPFLMPGTWAALAWTKAPSRAGQGWPVTTPGILETRNARFQTANPYTGRPSQIDLECRFTGTHYRRTTYAVMVDNNGNTWFVFIDSAGTWRAEPGIPHLDALNTTPWRYIQRQAPGGVTYYITPITNADGTGLYFDVTDENPGGVGTSAEWDFVNRRYEIWRLGVDDTPTFTTTRVA